MGLGSALRSAARRLFVKAEPPAIEGRLPLIPSWQNRKPIWSDWSTENAIRNGFKASVWVYRCCQLKARAVSQVPWIVEELQGRDWVRVEGHPIEILLSEANPYMSGQDLFECLTYHLHLSGNGLWHMVLVQGMPVELWPLMPDRIKPVPDQMNWISKYEYKIGTDKRDLQPNEVLHFMFLDPGNPYWGIGPLQAAARVVDTDNEAVNWQKVSLQNRAVADGVFSFEQPLTSEQWKEARQQVREQHQGVDNARTPWVLGGGAKWQQMSLTPVEMDFLNSRHWSVEEICAAFGVDPLLLLSDRSATYNNKIMARRVFWEDEIIPLLTDIQEALNVGLIPFWDPESVKPGVAAKLRIRYDVANVTALTPVFHEKVETGLKLFRMGIPVNMINRRLELGFDEIPGGDEPRFGGGGLGLLSAPGAPAKKQADEPSDSAAEEQKTLYWKAVESTRQSWEAELEKKIIARFEDEADDVAGAYEAGGENAVLDAIEDQIPEWENLLTAALIAIVEYAGQEEIDRLAQIAEKSSTGPAEFKLEFDPWAELIRRWVRSTAARHVQRITETTREAIRAEIRLGIDAGDTDREIAKRILDRYEAWATPADSEITLTRAMTIARTETHAAVHFGHRHGARQAAREWDLELTKEWISARDGRVRDAHSAIDGETHKMDESYSNGLMYPGDPSGPPEEVINCRCTERHRVIL